MDYPKSVPNVGLVGGKFVDENTSTGQVGSLIPSAWGSAVTDEIINAIKLGGLNPKENENNQLAAAIKEIVKQGMKVPLGSGVDFYNADIDKLYYRTAHDSTIWSLIVRLDDASEISAFDVGRATGKVSFSKRPTFAGYFPWDSGNLDPSTLVSSNNNNGVSGKISDVSRAQFINGQPFTEDLPPGVNYFSGIRAKFNDGKYGFDFGGSMTERRSFGRLTAGDGSGEWFEYWTSANFDPAVYAAKTQLATETNQGTMKVATDALMTDGGVDYVMATPKKLRKGMAFSFQPNGYFAFPSWMGGLVIQWGTSAAVPNDGRLSVNYPIEFPSACLIALANYKAGAGLVNHSQSFGVANISKTSFQIENQWIYPDSANSFSGVWLALGY